MFPLGFAPYKTLDSSITAPAHRNTKNFAKSLLPGAHGRRNHLW
jgi:hypothetical protein